MCAQPPSHLRGATLLELLVALVLIAAAATLAARGVPALARGQARAAAEWRGLIERVDARNGFARDLRFIELPAGDPLPPSPPFVGDRTRLGGAYRLEQATSPGWFAWYRDADRLERLDWHDATQARAGAAPDHRAVLLEGIARLDLRYLDAVQQWHDHWPPARAALEQENPLPRAVELRAVLAGGQELRWLVRPGLP